MLGIDRALSPSVGQHVEPLDNVTISFSFYLVTARGLPGVLDIVLARRVSVHQFWGVLRVWVPSKISPQDNQMLV